MYIKELRNNKGYTQEYIARKLNISLYHYQNIEHGKSLPNVILGLQLAKLLEVNPYSLWLNNHS